jgi:hypothetical protein
VSQGTQREKNWTTRPPDKRYCHAHFLPSTMSTAIPQPYEPFSISTDPFGDVVTDVSSAVASSSLPLLSSSSTPGRLNTISPMTQDATTQQYHPPQPTPMTALAGSSSSSSNGVFQGAIQPPAYSLDGVGVDLYHGGPHQLQHHPPPLVPAPPVMLPSQHDILHTTLHDRVNHSAAAQPTRMDGRDIPRQVPPPPSTLPFTATATPTTDEQPPGSQAPTSPRPKRRGRKPKNYNLSSSSSSTPGDGTTTTGDTDLDGDGLPKDAQRRRILERNRIAATKCRVRKRDEAEALAVRKKDMYDQNRQLATCFDSLAAEVYRLKTQLLRHTDCDCVLIQRYIANEARRSVDGMVTPVSGTSPSQHCGARGGYMPPVPVLTPVGGSSGGSPYHYGRLGSSTGSSSVDSASIRGPDDDGNSIPGHGPILWTNPFPPAATASASNPQIAPIPMSHPHLEPSPPDPMAQVNVLPMTLADVAGYSENLCVGVGPQAQRVSDVGWDYQWSFQ